MAVAKSRNKTYRRPLLYNVACWGALCVGILPTSFAVADPEIADVAGSPRVLYKHSYALLIGESEYSPWQPLPAVPDELQRLADALVRHGFDRASIDISPNLKYVDFVPKIQSFLALHGGADARVLVYYSGHGASDSNHDIGYLVPVDAPKQDDALFTSKAVPVSVIRALITESTAKHTLAIFDSCFSGTIFHTRGNMFPSAFSAQKLEEYSKRRVQIITAGDADQQVPGNSEFADSLIRGLDGAARFQKNPVITADDLATWLSNDVSETTVRAGSAGPETGGQFMFAVSQFDGSTNSSSKQNAADHAVTLQPPPPNEGLRAPAVEEILVTGQHISRPAPSGPKIKYYKKSSDGLVVLRALDKIGIPYEALPPQIGDRFAVNSLACSEKANFGEIKEIAKKLLFYGVPLRMIFHGRHGGIKSSVPEIVTFEVGNDKPLSSPILTADEIDNLHSCPAFFWHGQKNANQEP